MKIKAFYEKENLFLQSPMSNVQCPESFFSDYIHFRYYASTMGRFLKPDNIIPNAANPQSWNLYSYVNGNPVNFNDPSGHDLRGRTPLGTSKVLFGQYGPMGLSPAYGGIWENPQEKGTMGEALGSEENLWASSISGQGLWNFLVSNDVSPTLASDISGGHYVTYILESSERELGVSYYWVQDRPVNTGYGGESGTSGSSAIGAIRELAGVFLKESFNFGNRWPRYVFSKQSCYDYAYDLKERITNQHLEYWKAKVYVKETYFFGSESPYGPAHFSIVLEPINGNPLPNVWIDFYTYPQIQLWAYPHEWVIGPVRFSFHED
jgi:RHS repeat-associated protein